MSYYFNDYHQRDQPSRKMSRQSSGSSGQYFVSPAGSISTPSNMRQGRQSPSQSYSSIATSPSDHAPHRREDRSESSPLQNLVGYMEDLPSLSEVKAACDCYADECGDFGTSLQLCYVNRVQLDDLWLQLCSMQMTKLQLAFLFAVLANVGVGTPAAHPQYALDSLLCTSTHERSIRHAIELLDDVEAHDGASSQALMRCHLLLLIAYYLQDSGRYEEGWQTCKRAVVAAHACHLFELQKWQHAAPHEHYTVKVLQGEVPFLFNWMAFTMEGSDSVPFNPGFPSHIEPPFHPEDLLDQAFMQQKMKSSTFARKAARKIAQSRRYSPKELFQLAMSLDDEILAIDKSQHPQLRETAQYAVVDTQDRGSVYLATYTLLTRGALMLQRWRIAQTFYERHPVDVFQYIALCSARTTLQMLPIVQQCFRSPWQTITNRSWIDGYFNQALFIFLTAIKSQLYPDNSPAAASNHLNYTEAIRGEVVWFMSNFNRLYTAMNRLGMVRTGLAQCATALKETPVQIRSQSDEPLSPNEPIFQLSDDDQDANRRRSLHHYEDLSRMFRDEYTSHSVFKAAFSTHSN